MFLDLAMLLNLIRRSLSLMIPMFAYYSSYAKTPSSTRHDKQYDETTIRDENGQLKHEISGQRINKSINVVNGEDVLITGHEINIKIAGAVGKIYIRSAERVNLKFIDISPVKDACVCCENSQFLNIDLMHKSLPLDLKDCSHVNFSYANDASPAVSINSSSFINGTSPGKWSEVTVNDSQNLRMSSMHV